MRIRTEILPCKRPVVLVRMALSASCFTFVMLNANALAQATASESSLAADQFKDFLSHPPVITDLVFRQKLKQDPNRPQPYDGSFERSTNFALFKGRWQTNALQFYSITEPDARPEYVRGHTIVSIFDDQHWLLDRHSFIETCAAPFGSLSNPVAISIAFKVEPLLQVLQGGVLHVRPGDMHWNGDQFVARHIPSPYKVPFDVEGELIKRGEVPDYLLVTYTSDDPAVAIRGRWKIRYSYTRSLSLAWFPSRITGLALVGGQEVEMYDFEVLRLETGQTPLPPSAFDPQPSLALPGMAIHVFTNGDFYELRGGQMARWQATPQQGLQKLTTASTFSRRLTALTPLAAFNFLFLVNLVCRERKQKNNNLNRN